MSSSPYFDEIRLNTFYDFYDDKESEDGISSDTIKREFNNIDKKKEKEDVMEKLKTANTFKENVPLKDTIINSNSLNINAIKNNIFLGKEKQFIKDNFMLKKKILGRKKKYSKEKGKHNKYSEDNIIRKIKSTLLSCLSNFINNKIYRIYNGNVGKGILIKELKKMNQNQIIDSKRNKEFLNKTLKDIFSNEISSKYTNYHLAYNRELIKILLNEQDESKRMQFQNLFSLSFLNCLMHFRGSKYFDELEGLEYFDDIAKKFEDDKEYLELFRYYVNNFEEIIIRKRQRKTD